MNKRLQIIVCVVMPVALFSGSVSAAGISVDAGLTPPEDRWIIRNQLRYMEREDDLTSMDREVDVYAFPFIVAYGLRSDLTLLVRQRIIHRNLDTAVSMNRDTGYDDLFILAKYKLFRQNTRNYTFGIASTLGLEMPTGDDDFGSDTWDLQPGLFSSWRSGPWQSDFSVSYKWNGFADDGRNGLEPGDELAIDFAFAHQFNLSESADTSLTPLLELNYKHFSNDNRNGYSVPNTGESIFFVSPGLKFTKGSFILEGLVQFPVWQDQEGSQLEQGIRYIIGTRFLF